MPRVGTAYPSAVGELAVGDPEKGLATFLPAPKRASMRLRRAKPHHSLIILGRGFGGWWRDAPIDYIVHSGGYPRGCLQLLRHIVFATARP